MDNIKRNWIFDEEGIDKGLEEKGFKYWKIVFFSAKLKIYSLLYVKNMYKYNSQMSR